MRIILGIAVVAMTLSIAQGVTTRIGKDAATSPKSSPALESSLSSLSNGTTQQKQQALRVLVEGSAALTPDVVHAISQPLLKETDASLRQQAAETVSVLASRRNVRGWQSRTHEPQLLAILTAAYSVEKDPVVRRVIVQAIGEINDPEAALELNRALADCDPGVKEAAQKAKLKRDRRLFFSRVG